MSERAFIEALRALAPHPAARGLADDAAVLEVGGETLVLTHDAMAEGIHFLPQQDAFDVAFKLVVRNLSDLAAKGAEPLGVLLGYQLGTDDRRFLEGLRFVLDHYQVPLLGGDTIGSVGPRVLSMTAIGRATHVPVPSRGGACVGDALYLTGPVGAAMMGFEALQVGEGDSIHFRYPIALLAHGVALAPKVTAMMDVSDGLLIDATRMADASKATLAIDSAAVPITAPEARRDEALRWGDDYQLLFTLPPNVSVAFAIHRIGTVLPRGEHPLLLNGTPPSGSLGYQH